MKIILCLGVDPRGLEHRPLRRDGEDQPLGRPLLCRPDDLRELRPLQLARGHPRRRILQPGRVIIFLYFPPRGCPRIKCAVSIIFGHFPWPDSSCT